MSEQKTEKIEEIYPFPNISLKDVEAAAERIGKYIHKTPVLTCETLDGFSKKTLFFKCENFQKVFVGSFTREDWCF